MYTKSAPPQTTHAVEANNGQHRANSRSQCGGRQRTSVCGVEYAIRIYPCTLGFVFLRTPSIGLHIPAAPPEVSGWTPFAPFLSIVRRPFSAAPAGSRSRLQGDKQLHKRRSTARRFPSHIQGLPGVKLDRFTAFVSDLSYQENETF
ncbi:hypothetical protein MRX96_051316 [Rhipicephalus microplus]